MFFNLSSSEETFLIEQRAPPLRGFILKKANPIIQYIQDNSVKFEKGHLIGNTWISQIATYNDQIEEFYIDEKDNVQVLIKNSLQVQNRVVRRDVRQRITLHGDSIVNYHEGIIIQRQHAGLVNGIADRRITRSNYYIKEMNEFINQECQIGQLTLNPKVDFQRVKCVKINEELACLSLIGQEQVNYLIRNGEQVEFYEDCDYLLGQINYFQEYFINYDVDKLMLIDKDGVCCEEEIGEGFTLDGQALYQMRDYRVSNAQDIYQIRINYKKININLITKQQKSKQLVINNQVQGQQLVMCLIETDDQQFIEQQLSACWKSLSKQDLIALYEYLSKSSIKMKAYAKLLQCYEPDTLELSFENLIKSDTFDVSQFLHQFQYHLIYNYVHTLQYIINHKIEYLQYFLPNDRLFYEFQGIEEDKLLTKNNLNNLEYLAKDQLPRIKTDYVKIATTILGTMFGQYRQIQTIQQEQSITLYNLLVKDSRTRMTYQEFIESNDLIGQVITQSPNLKQTLNQLKIIYKNRLYPELSKQLETSSNYPYIFEQISQDTDDTQFLFNAIVIIYERLQASQQIDLYKIINAIKLINNKLNEQQQEQVLDMVAIIEQVAQLSQVLQNFHILFPFHQYKQFQTPKCLDQLLENYLVGRIKQQQFIYNGYSYNLIIVQDLRQLMQVTFKPFIQSSEIDKLILKKYLDFGKYREAKFVCSHFPLTLDQYDEVISTSMERYLELQRKIDLIEAERKKFQELIVEVQRLVKTKLPKVRKMRHLYKFIVEVKEVGQYRFNDVKKCNQTIFYIYKRSQNYELPYIRYKRKLAKANDLEIFDKEFCKFMIEIAQKNIQSNPQRAQLILEELQGQGADVSILLLQLSKDEEQKQNFYWKVLKQSSTAESIQTLIRLYPSQEINLIPNKLEILNTSIINQKYRSELGRFQQEYRNFYSNSLIETVFLDSLLGDVNYAFEIVKKKKYNINTLVQQLCQSELLDNERVLKLYLKSMTNCEDWKVLLQEGGIIQDIAESYIIAKNGQMFHKDSLFNKQRRKDELYQLFQQVDVENIIPELEYFKDIDVEDMKCQAFVKRLKSINLREYYLKKQQNIQNVIHNSIKKNPYLEQIDIDCRYHWIMHENKINNDKERIIIRSFLNQCILSDQLDCWDRIYRQLIQHNKDYSQVADDFIQITTSSNWIILSEVVKYYYNDNLLLLRPFVFKLQQHNQQKILDKIYEYYPELIQIQ